MSSPQSTPLAPYWKAVSGADANGNPTPEPGPWREAATDPPPAPPTEVFWLSWPAGMPDGEYKTRAEMGALPSFKAPQAA